MLRKLPTQINEIFHEMSPHLQSLKLNFLTWAHYNHCFSGLQREDLRATILLRSHCNSRNGVCLLIMQRDEVEKQ